MTISKIELCTLSGLFIYNIYQFWNLNSLKNEVMKDVEGVLKLLLSQNELKAQLKQFNSFKIKSIENAEGLAELKEQLNELNSKIEQLELILY